MGKRLLSLILVLIFMTYSTIALANDNSINDEEPYVETIKLNKADLKELEENGQVTLDPNNYSPYLLLNERILVELDEDWYKQKMIAQESNYSFNLASVTYNFRFKNSNGETVKNKEYKELISKKLKVSKNKSVTIASSPGPQQATYSYMYSKITVTDQVDSFYNKRRHYLQARHVWNDWVPSISPTNIYQGSINTLKYDGYSDVAVMAWSSNQGPILEADKTATAIYKNGLLSQSSYSGTGFADSLIKDSSSDGFTSAWKIPEKKVSNGETYYLKEVALTNYTGWYDPSKFGANGQVKTQFAHGFTSKSISTSVGISPTSVSISFTPTSTADVEVASIYNILSIN